MGFRLDLNDDLYQSSDAARKEVDETSTLLQGKTPKQTSNGLRMDFDSDPVAPAPASSDEGVAAKDYGIALAKGVVGAAQGIYGIADMATLGVAERAVNAVTGTTVAEKGKEVQDWLDSKQSTAMQTKQKDLANTEGFFASAGKVLSDPALAGSMLVESVPMMASMAGAIRKVGAVAFERTFASVMEREVAKGVAKDVAKQTAIAEATTFAAARGTLASIGINAAVEAGSTSQDVKATIMTMDRADLDMSPQFQKLIADGNDERTARIKLSQDAGNVAGAISGVIGGAATKFSGAGALESKLVRDIFGFGAKDVSKLAGKTTARSIATEAVKGFGKEALEEGAQSAGEQFGGNVGKNFIGKKTDLMEGVPEAVGAGAALGGLSGAGFGVAGQVLGRKDKPKDTSNTQTSPKDQKPPEGSFTAPVMTEQLLRQRFRKSDGLNYLAALYSEGSAEQKSAIDEFVTRNSMVKPFSMALNNPERVDAGRVVLKQDIEGNDYVLRSIESYIETPSKRGKQKYVAPTSKIPGINDVDFKDTNTKQFADADGNEYDIVNLMNMYKDDYGNRTQDQHMRESVAKFLSTGGFIVGSKPAPNAAVKTGKKLDQKTSSSNEPKINLVGTSQDAIDIANMGETTNKDGTIRFSRGAKSKPNEGTLVIPGTGTNTDSPALTEKQEKIRQESFLRKSKLSMQGLDPKAEAKIDHLLGFPVGSASSAKSTATEQSILTANKLMSLIEEKMAKDEADKKAATEALKATEVKADETAVEKLISMQPSPKEEAEDTTAIVDNTVESRVVPKKETVVKTPRAKEVEDFVRKYVDEVDKGIKATVKSNDKSGATKVPAVEEAAVERQIQEWVNKGVIFTNEIRKMPRAVQQYYNSRSAAAKKMIDEMLSEIKPEGDKSGGVTMRGLYKESKAQDAEKENRQVRNIDSKTQVVLKDVSKNKQEIARKKAVETKNRNDQAKEFQDARTTEDKTRTRLSVRIRQILNMNDSASSYELVQRMRAELENELDKKVQAPTKIEDLEIGIKTIEARMESMGSYVKTLATLDQEIADLEGILQGRKPRSETEYIFIKGEDGNIFGTFAEDPSSYDAARQQLTRLTNMRRDISRRNGPALRDLFFSNYLFIGQELSALKAKALQYVEDNPDGNMTAEQVREQFKDAEAQVFFVQQSLNTSAKRENALSAEQQELSDAIERDANGDVKTNKAQLAIEQKLNPRLQEMMDDIMSDLDEAAQMGMFGGQELANAAVEDMLTLKVPTEKAVNMLADEIRKGSFNIQEVRNAFRSRGIDAPSEIHRFLGQPHAQTSLQKYVDRAANKYIAMQEWLGSLQSFYEKAPKWLIKARKASLTTDEKTIFADYTQQLSELRNRKIESEGDTVESVFPHALFRRFSLSQMRNPSKIADEQLRQSLLSIYGDGKGLVQQWLNDLFLVQTQRPDLFRSSLRELAPTERKQYIGWAKIQRNADKKREQMIAKSAYYSQFINIDFPNTPEGRERQDYYKALFLRSSLNEQKAIVLDAFAESRLLSSTNKDTFKETIDRLEGRPLTAEELLDSFFTQMQERDAVNGLNPEQYAEYMRQRGFDQNAPMQLNEQGSPVSSIDALDYVVTGIYENDDTMSNVSDEQDINDLESDAYMGQDDDGILQKRGQYSGRFSAAVVRNFVRDLTNTWTNAPRIEVFKNISSLPDGVRDRVYAALGGDASPRGMFDSATGTTYLFSDNLRSQTDVQFVLFHEMFGHFGMRGILGDKLDSFLNSVYKTNPTIRKMAEQMVLDEQIGLLEAIEEVLADQAAVGKNAGLFKSYVGKAINYLRQAGFDKVADFLAKLSDAEIVFVFKASRYYGMHGGSKVMNGAPSEVRFNRDRPLPYEIYAERDGNFLGYARYNPQFGDWYVFASKSQEDIRSGEYKSFIVDSPEAAIAALRKTGGRITERTRTPLYVDDTTPRSGFVKAPKFNDITGWKKYIRSGIINFQNEYYAIREYETFLKDSGRMEGLKSPYQMLKLMEAKAVHLLERMDKTYYEPYLDLMERLQKATGKEDSERDVLDFLYARHATERNRAVSRIRSDNEKGSGMSDAEAAEILKSYGFKLNASNRVIPIDAQNMTETQKIMNDIGELFDRMSKEKLNYLVQTGMLTSRQAVTLGQYRHYISLSGLPGEKLDEEDMSQFDNAKKLNVRGSDARRALGRKTKADDIMTRTFMGYRSSIIRGQKNLVGQSVLEMLEANKDPTFVKINPIAEKEVIEQTGYRLIPDVVGYKTIPEYMVVKKLDENFINADDVMVVKVGGRPFLLKFEDTRAGSFFDALHGRMFRNQPGKLNEAFGVFNRLMGQMLTTWNPAWILVNGVRDFQTAVFNAATDGRISKSDSVKMIRLMPKALATAAAYYAPNNGVFKGDPKMLKYLEEMSAQGGLTLFLGRKDAEDYMTDLRVAMGSDLSTPEKIRAKTKALGDFMEKFTIPVEVMPRLAAYVVARESKNFASPADAAEFAKELTVNFNMRGQSKTFRNLYLFANPAVQGSAKLIELAKNNPKRFAAAASAWAVTGFMMSLVARAAGVGDADEDGEEAPFNQLDQIPDYKRSTSLILAPGKWFGAIPIAYGWNGFYALGHHGMDAVLGVQPLSVVAGRVAKAFTESFLPNTAGLEASTLERKLLMTASPTAVLPVVQLAINENRYGAPIYQEKNPLTANEKADSYMNFNSSSPISTGLARGLNEVFGGTKYESSGRFTDFNPSVVDFLITSYGAGLIAESYKGASLAVRVGRGEELDRMPLPIVDRFSAYAPEGFDTQAFRKIREKVETVYKEIDETRDPARKEDLMNRYEGIGAAHAVVSGATQQQREINQRLSQAEAWVASGEMSRDEFTELKNQMKIRSRAIYHRAVKAAIGAGFKKEALE